MADLILVSEYTPTHTQTVLVEDLSYLSDHDQCPGKTISY